MDENRKSLLSVGIDVGTTTTQLVLSELSIENTAPRAGVPRFRITGKNVIYIGQVHFTPLKNRSQVDAQSLQDIVKNEYARAGVKVEDIDTGAVIITGESAKKDNADQIIHSLARLAGNFVAASAGPDLESIIAGKGSGACRLSKSLGTLVNVDIGGGTANIAVFQNEQVLSTACLNVGGRLIEIDPMEKKVLYITPAAAEILQDLNDPLKVGDQVDKERLLPLVRRMVAILDQILLGDTPDPLASKLLMSGPLTQDSEYSGIMFSGGVGTYFYNLGKDLFVHGDLGILFALALQDARVLKQKTLYPVEETLHATVLGAGAHTVNVSGSTTNFDAECLPLRNLPIIPLETAGPQRLSRWRKARQRFLGNQAAYWLPHNPSLDFAAIRSLARDLIILQSDFCEDPLVVLTKDDVGKVLGQTVRFYKPERFNLICLDEIEVQDGDYIDIGYPLPWQEAVPVVIKTLVFAH